MSLGHSRAAPGVLAVEEKALEAPAQEVRLEGNQLLVLTRAGVKSFLLVDWNRLTR